MRRKYIADSYLIFLNRLVLVWSIKLVTGEYVGKINICLRFSKSKTSVELAAAATAKSLHSCLTLCNPIDGSPSGSPVPVILQPRTLEWVAISFSNA